ncbi:hypothetical protein [Ferviditalea candida]|uniref:Copper amine oxidase-like N-terminal domain-containing protein n=1 Tax=Ferviditalea candida TaxID=3108399 RepID=A0ABU5ZG48_9BACL|nr:hypothetical protein [Paenibacillaceae bacterium T2]
MKAKKILISLCLTALGLFTQVPIQEVAHASTNETPVLLKVNDFYVLYTTPKAPYIDSNNRLMIPLRSISSY